MKIRDKFTGAEFDNIIAASNWFCEHSIYGNCNSCPLDDHCEDLWVTSHPKEAVELMSMKIINDEEGESAMDNKIYDIDFTKYNCVHPATEEDAKILISKAYEAGYSWTSGDRNITYWDVYRRDTAYYFESNKRISYGDIERVTDHGCTAVEYPFTTPQPRICDILGVKVGEQFMIEGCDAKFEILYNGHYKTTPANVANSSYAFLDAIQNPSLVHKVPTVKLSTKDREFFQMIYDRMGDGECYTTNDCIGFKFYADDYYYMRIPMNTFDAKFEKDTTYRLSEVLK